MWNNVSKHSEFTSEHQTQGFDPPPHTHRDLQTPKRRACSRYSAPNNGDSPGDEVSQDIIWDPTSPTQPHTGKGPKTTRQVKISEIVDRIAPKDARPVESTLLQWIGDSVASCTPEARPPRTRRRSVRQSSVDGLIELARQFDKNMERSDAMANGPPAPCCPSESQQAEAELRALFDSSTQVVSRPLSQGSATPGCSQETRRPPPPPLGHTAPTRPPESGGVGGVAPCGPVKEFDDDWENDDLLNDSLVIDMAQEAELLPRPLPKTTTSRVTARVNSSPSPPQGGSLHAPKPSSDPRGVCPRPKTTQRSTFKLEPNPRYLSPTASTNHTSGHLHTVKPVKAQTPVAMQPVTTVKPVTMVKPVTVMKTGTAMKTVTAVKPVTTVKPVTMKPVTAVKPQSSETLTAVVKSDGGADSRGALNPDRSSGDLDCSWDEGGDDQLLFQVCEDVEKLSNNQPTPATPTDAQPNATAPVAIGPAWCRSASRQLACGYVRSNSVPGASGDSVSYQGWSVQMKGGGVGANQSALSQSHPGSHVGLGTFSHLGDASGTFQDNQKTSAGFQPQTVTARPPGNSKSHHATFKRHLSDSAAISSKAWVGGQGNAKCSAAEIERKKQEALARKRQRMHNSQKH